MFVEKNGLWPTKKLNFLKTVLILHLLAFKVLFASVMFSNFLTISICICTRL